MVPFLRWKLGGRQEHVVLLPGTAEGCSLFGDFRKGIIAGSMAFCMGWGLVFSYKLLCPRAVRTLFEGVQQSLFPGVKGLSSVVVLLPGYACLSVEIFLQFPWQEQRVTHIPWGDISTFLWFFRLLWHFPSPVVGASGSSLYTTLDNIPAEVIWPFNLQQWIHWLHGVHSVGVGFLRKTLKPTVETCHWAVSDTTFSIFHSCKSQQFIENED